MKERITVRLLLLDRAGRILLMKIDDSAIYGPAGGLILPSPRWITLGGGLEVGETIVEAASREAFEESGITGITIGPAVWYLEEIGMLRGEPGLYKETFVVAHAPSCETSTVNWTSQEKEIVRELRWWGMEELTATNEIILPRSISHRLPDIIAGNYPAVPEVIEF